MKKIQIDPKDYPFLGLLVLFAGFSLYGVISMSSTLSSNIDRHFAANVIGVSDDGSYTGSLDATDAEEIFTDVFSNHPNATAISYFKQMGYVGGYEDGSFRPDQLLNRAELFTILTNAVNADFTGGVYEKCFKDVGTEWFATFVCYAKDKGWVGGFDDGTYRPGNYVTVSEVVKIIFKAEGMIVPESVTEKPFPDVPIDVWYAPYAKAAKDAHVITTESFSGNSNVSRAAFVQMMYNAILYVKE